MAKSKDQLLAKIDNLILEVNSQYAELKISGQLEGVEVALLASNIDYLSAHIKALHYFGTNETIGKNKPKENELFTPAINLKYEADEQEVFEEIQEKTIWKEEAVVNTPAVEIPKIVVPEPIIEKPVAAQPIVEVPTPEPVVQQPIVQQPIVEQPEAKIAIEEPVATTVVINEVIEEEKTVIVEETIITSKTIVETIGEAPSRPLTINELIHQQKQAGLNMTQQFQTSTSQDKILDLKAAISLNDKLLFIKDLFNGYSLAYSEALELLNRFDNYAEADAFLQANYALKNGWSEKPQSVDKFYALLRKKFN